MNVKVNGWNITLLKKKPRKLEREREKVKVKLKHRQKKRVRKNEDERGKTLERKRVSVGGENKCSRDHIGFKQKENSVLKGKKE